MGPACSLMAVTGPTSSGSDQGPATVIGMAMTFGYFGLLIWLNIRRCRGRRAERALEGGRVASRPASGQADGERLVADASAARSEARPATARRRVRAETLEPLGAQLERSRRIVVAEARVGEVLDRLPESGWLVERYVVVAGQRVPFVVLGPTGVFAIWALDEAPGWDDMPYVNRTAGALRELMPGYGGAVQVGLCRAFAPVRARWWYSAEQGCGAWLLGLNWLERWLEHFDDETGLAEGDIAWAARLASPRWRRPDSDGLPRTPRFG